MALLVWTMVGLALWHFTVFLPGQLLGRDRRRVPRRAARLDPVRGLLINLGGIPGEERHASSATGLEAIPGALLGMGLVWWIGVRQIDARRAQHHGALLARAWPTPPRAGRPCR